MHDYTNRQSNNHFTSDTEGNKILRFKEECVGIFSHSIWYCEAWGCTLLCGNFAVFPPEALRNEQFSCWKELSFGVIIRENFHCF